MQLREMDDAEVNARQRWTVAARCLNRVGEGSLWRPLCSLIGHNINQYSQLRRNVFIHMHHVVYAHSAISLVKSVNPKSQIHAQKRYTSEARPSFRGWRGWHTRLASGLAHKTSAAYLVNTGHRPLWPQLVLTGKLPEIVCIVTAHAWPPRNSY